MKRKQIRIAILTMLVLVGVMLMTGCKGKEEEVTVNAGDAAPDFTAQLADGTSFTLSEAKGMPVMLNFWGTHCEPCIREFPAIQKLDEEYGDRIKIIAINTGEKTSTVDKFIESNSYNFAFAYDPEDTISNLYPSMGIPFTVLIDKDGKIRETHLGASESDEMYELYKGMIEGLINEEK